MQELRETRRNCAARTRQESADARAGTDTSLKFDRLDLAERRLLALKSRQDGFHVGELLLEAGSLAGDDLVEVGNAALELKGAVVEGLVFPGDDAGHRIDQLGDRGGDGEAD